MKQDDNTDLKDDVMQTDTLPEEQPENNEEIAKLQADFNALQAQSADMQNQLKRALADYQNLEKRIAEGRSELTSWATGNLLIQILPVLDNLEKAMEGMNEEEKKSGWAKGVEMSVKQLKEVLKGEGLEQIDIRADGQFDPALHEAVDTKEGEDDRVLEVVTKGYNLKGKVLRPARVVVGRKEQK
jgi:molecular chaperone GrpE